MTQNPKIKPFTENVYEKFIYITNANRISITKNIVAKKKTIDYLSLKQSELC